MKSTSAQWILWAVTMLVFLCLTLTGHFKALGIAMVACFLVWYTVVPRTTSR